MQILKQNALVNKAFFRLFIEKLRTVSRRVV